MVTRYSNQRQSELRKTSEPISNQREQATCKSPLADNHSITDVLGSNGMWEIFQALPSDQLEDFAYYAFGYDDWGRFDISEPIR